MFQGLSQHSLSLLQPCALTMRLTAEPLPAAGAAQAPVALQLTAAPAAADQQQQQQGEQAKPYSRFPALAAALGQPLCVTLAVTNHGRTLPSGGSGGGGGGGSSGGGGEPGAAPVAALELQLEAAVCCQPVRGSEQGEAGAAAAAPADLSAVWAGQLWSGLRLAVLPGATVQQRLGLCLLAPGLYRVGLQHWRCTPAGAPAAAPHAAKHAPPPPLLNTLADVQPCYVLADQR